MSELEKALRLIRQEASDSIESALIPRCYLSAMLDERDRLLKLLHRSFYYVVMASSCDTNKANNAAANDLRKQIEDAMK